MKIKVLGCSNSWTDRHTSCYLVNDDILLDCGTDAYKSYLHTGKPLTDIKLFLFTHLHSDHIFGLSVFLICYQRGFCDFKPTIVGPKGIKEHCHKIFSICNLFEYDFSDTINFVEVEEGSNFNYNGLKITAHKLDHGDVEDYGYTIKDGQKTFGYTGDTTLCKNLNKFIEQCDLCFVDICRETSTSKHLGLDNFYKLKQQFPKTKLLATHCVEKTYHSPALKRNKVIEGKTYKI